MDYASKLTEYQILTKSRGKETTKRWQFDRSADGLLEAIRIFGAARLTGFINEALRMDARKELEGNVPFGKVDEEEEQK